MLDYTKTPNQSDVYNSKEWLKDPNHYPKYELVWKELNPNRVLEIGTYLGMSLMALVAACDNIHWIDFVDNETGLTNSNELALENINWAVKNSSRIDNRTKLFIFPWTDTKEIVDKVNFFNVIHIDGDHRYEPCKKDLEFSLSLKPQFIIGHDFHLEGSGVERAVRDVCQKEGLTFWHTKELTHGLFLIALEDQSFTPKSLNFVKG